MHKYSGRGRLVEIVLNILPDGFSACVRGMQRTRVKVLDGVSTSDVQLHINKRVQIRIYVGLFNLVRQKDGGCSVAGPFAPFSWSVMHVA